MFIKVPEGEYFRNISTEIDLKTNVSGRIRAHVIASVSNLFYSVYGGGEVKVFFDDEIEDAIKKGLVDSDIISRYKDKTNKITIGKIIK